MKLVVLIPAFNEEKTIGKVIQEIPKDIEGIDEMKILLVDDGSTDNTAEIAKKAGAFVISHAKNKGLGIAFSTGIKEALKQGADIVVNIDADNQFDPRDITKLVKPILEKKAEMVAGTRFEDETSARKVPFIKRWGNKAFTSLINILIRQHFTDTQCGFRAYSKEAILRLNLFGKFTYTQEVFLDLVNKGLTIKQVPIKVRYYKERQAKITSSLFGYFLRTIVIILRTFRDYKPLVFFGIPGFIIFLIGFLISLFMFVRYIILHVTSPFKSLTQVGIALIIVGMLMIVLALIADMLKRIRQNQEEILYRLKKREFERK